MSGVREVRFEADLDENTATATIRTIVEISELFNDDGELRLWQDDAGWNGYLREQHDDGRRFYHVNTRPDEVKTYNWRSTFHPYFRLAEQLSATQ